MEAAYLGLQKGEEKEGDLCDEKRQALVAKTVVLPPPVIVQVLQECITSQPI